MIKLWTSNESNKRKNTNVKTEWDSSPEDFGIPLPRK